MYVNIRVTTISQRWLNHGFTIFFLLKKLEKKMKRETDSVNVKWFSQTTIYFFVVDLYHSNYKKQRKTM